MITESDTPRTDKIDGEINMLTDKGIESLFDFARQLERELAEKDKQILAMRVCKNCRYVAFCGCGLNQPKCKQKYGIFDMSAWQMEE